MVKPTDLEDPRVTLVALLEDNWDPANTPSVGTPSFSTEQLAEVDKDRPLVTVTNREDTPQAATAYSAIRGDGSGPSQRTIGFVVVNCWAEDRAAEDTGSQSNPKEQAKEMWNEVARIVLAHASGTGDLEFLRTDGPMADREMTETGPIYRLLGRIDYSYHLTPA